MRNGAGHGHEESGFARTVGAGNDHEISFGYGHGHIIQSFFLREGIGIGQVLYADDPFLLLLQHQAAVVAVLYVGLCHVMHGFEKTERREIKERCDNAVSDTYHGYCRKHTIEVYLHRNPHDQSQNGNKGETRHAGGNESCNGRAERKFPDFNGRHGMGKEACHIGAKEFRSKVAVGESGLTGKDFHQRRHHADAQALLVARFRQKNGHHIAGDHPVRRKTCH